MKLLTLKRSKLDTVGRRKLPSDFQQTCRQNRHAVLGAIFEGSRLEFPGLSSVGSASLAAAHPDRGGTVGEAPGTSAVQVASVPQSPPRRHLAGSPAAPAGSPRLGRTEAVRVVGAGRLAGFHTSCGSRPARTPSSSTAGTLMDR